jgi:hypothetical protein
MAQSHTPPGMYFPTIDYCQFQFPATVDTLEKLYSELEADDMASQLDGLTQNIIHHELEHMYQNRSSPAWIRLYFPNLLANIIYLNLLEASMAGSRNVLEREEHSGILYFVLSSLDVNPDEFAQYQREYPVLDTTVFLQLFHFSLQVGIHCHLMIILSMWEPLQEVSARIAEAMIHPHETRDVLADHYDRLSSEFAETETPTRPATEEFMDSYDDDMESILEMFRTEWAAYGHEYQRYVLYRTLNVLDTYGNEHVEFISEFARIASNLTEQTNPSSVFLRFLDQIEINLARRQSDALSDRILLWLQNALWWLIPDTILFWLVGRRFSVDLTSITTEDAHLEALDDFEEVFHALEKIDPSNPLFDLFEPMKTNLEAVAHSPLPSLLSFTDRGIQPSPTIADRFDDSEIRLLKFNAGVTVIRWSAMESILQQQNVMSDIEPVIGEFVEGEELQILYEQTDRMIDELITREMIPEILELASRFQSQLGFGFFQRRVTE